MIANIKVKQEITVREFIEILAKIENQESKVTVPDWDNYGCDSVEKIEIYSDLIVIE